MEFGTCFLYILIISAKLQNKLQKAQSERLGVIHSGSMHNFGSASQQATLEQFKSVCALSRWAACARHRRARRSRRRAPASSLPRQAPRACWDLCSVLPLTPSASAWASRKPASPQATEQHLDGPRWPCPASSGIVPARLAAASTLTPMLAPLAARVAHASAQGTNGGHVGSLRPTRRSVPAAGCTAVHPRP